MDREKLINELNTNDANSIKLDTLVDIKDDLTFGQWEYDELLKVAQKHIDLLSQFPDQHIRNQLDINFVEAFANSQHDLSEVSFQPLIKNLDKTKDISFISMVIHFLAATGNKEYAPIVEVYLKYPNKEIQNIAKENLKYLK